MELFLSFSLPVGSRDNSGYQAYAASTFSIGPHCGLIFFSFTLSGFLQQPCQSRSSSSQTLVCGSSENFTTSHGPGLLKGEDRLSAAHSTVASSLCVHRKNLSHFPDLCLGVKSPGWAVVVGCDKVGLSSLLQGPPKPQIFLCRSLLTPEILSLHSCQKPEY